MLLVQRFISLLRTRPSLRSGCLQAQILFASNYFYDFGMGFPKASMLAFYWNFFAREDRRAIRNSLSAIGLFVAACYLAILFSNTFYCGKNVSVQWSQADDACSVFYARTPFLLNFALSLACYVVIYAWPLLPLSQHALRESTGLLVIFVLGALAIASGVFRFLCLTIGARKESLICKPSLRGRSGVKLTDWSAQISSACSR
jgi:hypothetical protein